MKEISRRLRRLEERHVAQRNVHGLNPLTCCGRGSVGDRLNRSGRPYEELLRERLREEKAFWESYDGDRSLAGILRSRYHRMGKR